MSHKFSGPGWPEDRIDCTFTYHNPVDLSPEVAQRTRKAYGDIRDMGGSMAKGIATYTKTCPESIRAINAIQEAVMLANAAIAIHGVRPPDGGDTVKQIEIPVNDLK